MRHFQEFFSFVSGVGIFEVDRELSMITKQRIIDSGVGSDLICVGEQPLHAVPLFKYHRKMKDGLNTSEDYSMPHWINLSFYSKNKPVGYSNFKSRIKIPRSLDSRLGLQKPQCSSAEMAMMKNGVKNSFTSYDAYEAYDDSVFVDKSRTEAVKRKLSDPELSLMKYDLDASDSNPMVLQNEPLSPGSDTTGAIFSSSWDDSNNGYNLDKVMKAMDKTFIGSVTDNTFDHQAIKRFLLRPGRALINPFDPNSTIGKVFSR